MGANVGRLSKFCWFVGIYILWVTGLLQYNVRRLTWVSIEFIPEMYAGNIIHLLTGVEGKISYVGPEDQNVA